MKEQRIENFDSFDPDEWNPVDDKTFHFRVNNELYGWFAFDMEWGIWRGRMFEDKTYEIPNMFENKHFNFIWWDIGLRFERWGLYPDQVNWLWRGHRYDVYDYSMAIRNIISPEPFMVYKTYEKIECCEIKTQYYIERREKAVCLEIEKAIRNDDIDLKKLWEMYVEQMRKRINEPFTATMGTKEKFTE